MNILVITEQRDAKWNKTSFETLAAAQQIAKDTGGTLRGVVIGKGVAALADELAAKDLAEVFLVEHDLLASYTPDGYSLALAQANSAGKARSRFAAAHLSGARFCAEARRISRQRNDWGLHRVPPRKWASRFRAPNVSRQNRRRRFLRRGRSELRIISSGSVSRRSRRCASQTVKRR